MSGGSALARGAVVLALAGAASSPRPAVADDDRPRVLVDRRATVPGRLWAELEASGEQPLDEVGGLPATAAPGTAALRARRDGRRLDVLVFAPDEGGWQVRASIPFGRHDADADAVRAAEVVRALRGQPPATPRPSASTTLAPASPAVDAPATVPAPSPPAPSPQPAPPPAEAPRPAPAATPRDAPPPAALAPRGFLPSVPGRFAVPGRAPAARPPANDEAAASPGPRLEVALGPALAIDATGAALAVEGSARLWVIDRVALGLFARPSVTATSVEADTGSADLHTGHAGASVAVGVASERDPRGVVVGLDVGVGWLFASGAAVDPYRGLDDADAAPSIAARVELRQPVIGPLSLGLALSGGAVVPALDVRFVDQVEATWGAPFGAAALRLGLGP